jgi:imidazolonepropionase
MSNTVLIKNIQSLYGITTKGTIKKSGAEMRDFGKTTHAWLLIKDGRIADFGQGEHPVLSSGDTNIIDASHRMVVPSFVDSHTHLVFAAWRQEEFVMRIKGKTYEEIAQAGEGILNSSTKLAQLSEEELFQSAYQRLKEVISQGTGAIEIKSGYGLTLKDELKILRVIQQLKKVSPIPIRSTFLGAHAIPALYKNNREGYIKLVIDEMLPAVANEQLADYCDVFCDKGFFTVDETDRILKAAAQYGMKAKIHGNELGHTGGIEVAVKNKALSVDHLEHTNQHEIDLLKRSDTMPVALPNCSFFLGIPYAPLRSMIDEGLAVCLASDYNPGSSPNGRMSFVISLACTQMKLTPEEAFNAATINGAYALELSSEVGSIEIGKRANILISNPGVDLAFVPYHFGMDSWEKVLVNGEEYR